MNRRSTYQAARPSTGSWLDAALGGALGLLALVVCIAVAATIVQGMVR